MRRSSSPIWNGREALDLLREEGAEEALVRHCISVYGVSILIGSQLIAHGDEVDMGLVTWGSLLHDIGRTRTHGPEHGYVSGQILREKGMDEELIRLVERHVGGGIAAHEAAVLGLPEKDFIPRTLEERLVCYADKLIASTRIITFGRALERYSKLLGQDHPSLLRLKSFDEEFGRYVGWKGT